MHQTNPDSEVEKFIKEIEQALPLVFPRHALTKLTSGLINSRTIANRMSSKNDGPPGVRIGRSVGFSRKSFIAWLRKDYLKNIK
jgi:predicted DNA-binding transcriptional regulator AlpA